MKSCAENLECNMKSSVLKRRQEGSNNQNHIDLELEQLRNDHIALEEKEQENEIHRTVKYDLSLTVDDVNKSKNLILTKDDVNYEEMVELFCVLLD